MPTSYLIVKAPVLSFLGSGRKALVASGHTHNNAFEVAGQPLTGVWCALRVGMARHACAFEVEGDLQRGAVLFRQSDRRQWIECDHDRRDVETPVHLWGCVEKTEWAKCYVLNADGTLSPQRNPTNVCLGVRRDEHGQAVVILVARSDTRRRLIFGGGPEMEAYFEELRFEAAERQARHGAEERRALSLLTPSLCRGLRDDGYCRIDGLVPAALVRAARTEINRSLGAGESGAGALKAKTLSTHAAVVALVTDSAVPRVLSELLGGGPEHFVAACVHGQIALRFPGDNCPEGWCPSNASAAEVPSLHWEHVRKGWHIDGCPNDIIPGLTDHYGSIQNFDALVGVLLSDVPEPMAGELVVYPGSHASLAAHFASNPQVLESIRTAGAGHLPTGAPTDRLFCRGAVHCTGRAGDVFVANYMTAHLIAPNCSPDIRYAVYFRVTGPRFDAHRGASGGNVRSMLQPWLHWDGLNCRVFGAVADPDGGGDRGAAAAINAVTNVEAAAQAERRRANEISEAGEPPYGEGRQFGVPPPPPRQNEQSSQLGGSSRLVAHLASADYSYLQRQHSRRFEATVRATTAAGEADGEIRGMAAHVDALCSMFPTAALETVTDVLHLCAGDAERAAERLLEMG